MAVKFNPFTGNFDFAGSGGSSGTAVIPEYATDPASPSAGDAWVLRSGTVQPYGLLLALTKPAVTTYQFSYRTNAGSTVRATLS